MGNKGSCFSATKKVFGHNSKEKQINELDKNSKEKRKKARGLNHRDTKSFIPIFREPSSIEKILEEADEQRLCIRPIAPFEPPKTPPLLIPISSSPRAASIRVTSPKAASISATSPKAASIRATSPKAASISATSPKAASIRATSPKAASIRTTSPKAYSQRVASPKATSSRVVNRQTEVMSYRPEPTLRFRHLSATKIQAAYRGYMARRSYRALRGLVRLQSVVRGQNARRQTASAMKKMQLLVRVQTQIHSQRAQASMNQSVQRQSYKLDKELESTLGNPDISHSEAGNQGDWDVSRLTKEEKEERMKKKTEAVSKRERAMAYAYSHQSWKSNPKRTHALGPNALPKEFPWWWNRLDHQLPAKNNPLETQSIRTFNLTPPRRTQEPKPSPSRNSTYKPIHYMTFENYEMMTPTSTRSMAPSRSKHFMPTPTHKTTPRQSSGAEPGFGFRGLKISGTIKYPKTKPGRARSLFEMGGKDDDSLASSSTYSVPNYMTPTASAQAKARPKSNPKERFLPWTPTNDSKKRFSFPLTPKTDSGSKKGLEKQESFRSGGDFSVDSAVSMPAAIGRKPFNRFV